MSKALVAAVAFLFVAAAPAFAQSYNPDLTTGNITQWYDYGNNLHRNPSPGAAPYSAYGEAPFYQPRAHVRSWRHTPRRHWR